MSALLFPGQGSQVVGMGSEFYNNFKVVKKIFNQADEKLNYSISKLILEGPEDKLQLTKNTQPAILTVSYSIFKVLKDEFGFDLKNFKFFAGHSLGEYSALCCAGSISFEQTVNLLKSRGEAMQFAVPNGEGGMMAVLGATIQEITKILKDNENNFLCYIANDNSIGQIVISGKSSSLQLFGNELRKKNIKFINLQVSSPFHCPLMSKATEIMKHTILDTEFKDPIIDIISNVTANPVNNSENIKKLLIDQIEKPVRWRESINNMINLGINHFIEIGPGKVLSGLVKRIDRNVKLNQVNNLIDAKSLTND